MKPKTATKRTSTCAQRKADRERLAVCIAEIVNNNETPDLLWDKITAFLIEASSGSIRDYWKDPKTVEHLLYFHAREQAMEKGE